MKKLETISSAALKYNLKRTTLNARIKKLRERKSNCEISDSGNSDDDDIYKFQSKYSTSQIFTQQQEFELSEYLKKCSRLCYGLTHDQVRKFAAEFAFMNKILVPESWVTNKKAGYDWLYGFIKRNNSLSLRKPEKTNISRIKGFSKNVVEDFFTKLRELMKQYSFRDADIFNLDETGITTVLESPKVRML